MSARIPFFTALILTLTAPATSVEVHIIGELKSASGKFIYSRNSRELIPPGSAMKPFAAIYFLNYVPQFPVTRKVHCPGWKGPDGTKACWLRPGHRWVDLESALAESCNHYFRYWAAGIDPVKYANALEADWALRLPIITTENIFGDGIELRAAELFELYRRLFIRLERAGRGEVPVQVAMTKTLTEGTLRKFRSAYEKKSLRGVRLLSGKTGSAISAGGTAGTVILLVAGPSGKKYLLLVHSAGEMGSDLAVKKVLPFMLKNGPLFR